MGSAQLPDIIENFKDLSRKFNDQGIAAETDRAKYLDKMKLAVVNGQIDLAHFHAETAVQNEQASLLYQYLEGRINRIVLKIEKIISAKGLTVQLEPLIGCLQDVQRHTNCEQIDLEKGNSAIPRADRTLSERDRVCELHNLPDRFSKKSLKRKSPVQHISANKKTKVVRPSTLVASAMKRNANNEESSIASPASTRVLRSARQ